MIGMCVYVHIYVYTHILLKKLSTEVHPSMVQHLG